MLARLAELMAGKLHEASAAITFAAQVMAVGPVTESLVGGKGTEAITEPVAVPTDAPIIRVETSPRRGSPVLARVLRDIAPAGIATNVDTEDDDDRDDDRRGELLELLRNLPDFRQIPRVGEKLQIEFPAADRVPRMATRSNAVLYLLDRFGRARPLRASDLVLGLKSMRAVDPAMDDGEARRLASWEANDLRRRGWPITKVPSEGFRFGEETVV